VSILDVGTEQAKLSVKVQLDGGKAEGEFHVTNAKGISIQGTGTGRVQANQMSLCMVRHTPG
jgi:hypothetical protein